MKIGYRPTPNRNEPTAGTVGDGVQVTRTPTAAPATYTTLFRSNLYGPSDNPDCSGSAVFTSTVNVSGHGNYNSGNFTPLTAGKYYWIASYSGDVNNLRSDGHTSDHD